MIAALDADLAEEGFQRIGRMDSVGRRSMWLRIECVPGGDVCRRDTVIALELRAGREGADACVRVTRDNPQFADLLEVMARASYAAEDAAAEDPRSPGEIDSSQLAELIDVLV